MDQLLKAACQSVATLLILQVKPASLENTQPGICTLQIGKGLVLRPGLLSGFGRFTFKFSEKVGYAILFQYHSAVV